VTDDVPIGRRTRKQMVLNTVRKDIETQAGGGFPATVSERDF
jgi:hypothetical protein